METSTALIVRSQEIKIKIKIKIIFVSAVILIYSRIRVFAQLTNMNPDPTGPVWITGDMAPGQPASIDWDFVELTPDANSQLMALPQSVDNSQKTWFPYIYNQGSSGSCVHVSEVFYTFTYELNRKYDSVAGDGENNFANLFHPLYSYNYLNDGYASTFTGRRDGFKIVRDCGVRYTSDVISGYFCQPM